MDARSPYRETAVRAAGPVRLVVLLYQQALEDLHRAHAALTRADIEGRTREINHALKVIGQLQGSLDLERGGVVARNLTRFYDMVRLRLVEAQITQSAEILEEQISVLALLLETWLEVERSTMPASAATEPARPGVAAPDGARSFAEWRV
jgi:flagellar secretion chaperone FliS